MTRRVCRLRWGGVGWRPSIEAIKDESTFGSLNRERKDGKVDGFL
jgi:hypothetical protein